MKKNIQQNKDEYHDQIQGKAYIAQGTLKKCGFLVYTIEYFKAHARSTNSAEQVTVEATR